MGMASLACWFAVVQAIIAMDLLSQIWCSLSKGRERYWLLQSDYVQPPCLCRERHRLVEVPPPGHAHHRRSEEHTSELQSLMRISYAVFCLKKKIDKYSNITHIRIC